MSNFTFGAAPNTSVTSSLTTSTGSNFGFGSGGTTTFGNPTTSATGFTFGAPTASTGTGLPSFGAPASTTGFSLGGTSGGTTLNFGGSTAAPATGGGGFSLNPPASSASGGLTFGLSAPAASSAAPNLGLNFGAPAASTAAISSASGFSFSAPTTSAAPLFGAGQSGFGNLSGGLFMGGTGGPATSSTLNFGGIPGSSVLSFGGASKPGLTLGTSAAPSSSSFVGLGGVETTFTSAALGLPAGGAQVSAEATKAPKDNVVPNEIMQAVEEFKNYVKAQKLQSSELSRTSSKPLHRVQAEIAVLSKQLDEIKARVRGFASSARSLHKDSAKTLKHAEMAQQTQDTPLGLQLENMAPDEYFASLVNSLESELRMYTAEVDRLQKLCTTEGGGLGHNALNKEDLMQAVRRMHEILISLAARLHAQHAAVEVLKDDCLSLRARHLHDDTDIFKSLTQQQQQQGRPSTQQRGVVSRSGFAGPPILSELEGALQSSPYGPAAQQQLTGSLSLTGGLGSGLGSSSGGGAMYSSAEQGAAVENRTFQLQQPPVGNKRGKR